MDTKVCFLSSLTMPLITGLVLSGAASQPAHPTTWSGWSALNLFSSATTLSRQPASSTVFPSGVVKVATTWLVRSRP
ncbi:hypothetical protein PICSAR240_03007 [Mycobacterium avium subsp. paratuberculosis]|nr:hypothetical protein PICSAR10_02117 [Mycobacterium avium subsp. paratuberculosis]CAG6903330.1 hypothetical protein PICSAR120_02776 [Mycobacterium avium subsp. paratuberculosis]CAG6904138.1 hypothetical protein PICSAR119_02836 [Mycobacterium avium subsp. paratuberculosis]CAG6905804.1 hypothetical protein PICSAR118_02949 [Mycobacterium avium subsp. paratuberculosis]CAG6906670.1 hypothetical protein PICSAR107_02921 [Mycobacterium avium subsp. paratuberculosis]